VKIVVFLGWQKFSDNILEKAPHQKMAIEKNVLNGKNLAHFLIFYSNFHLGGGVYHLSIFTFLKSALNSQFFTFKINFARNRNSTYQTLTYFFDTVTDFRTNASKI
jgi:hypothetical protein